MDSYEKEIRYNGLSGGEAIDYLLHLLDAEREQRAAIQQNVKILYREKSDKLKEITALESSLTQANARIASLEFEVEVAKNALDDGREFYSGEIKKLERVVGAAKHALEHTDKFCLCTRNNKGFDYSEVHPKQGKPGIGKRWLTPRDVVTPVLAQLTPSETKTLSSEERGERLPLSVSHDRPDGKECMYEAHEYCNKCGWGKT